MKILIGIAQWLAIGFIALVLLLAGLFVLMQVSTVWSGILGASMVAIALVFNVGSGYPLYRSLTADN